MAEWDAEVILSEAEVSEIVQSYYPEFSNSRVVGYAEGWDNAAFLVDDAILFRFPRRKIAVDGLTREIALLPRISTCLPLPISAPHYHGRWRDELQWPFAGYRLLVGQSASLRDLTDDERERLTLPLATFLRELHRIDSAPLVEAGLPSDSFGRFNAEKLLPRMLTRSSATRDAGYDVPSSLMTWVQEHPPCLGEQRAIVHGDLYARHLLLDEDGVLGGIIDWGDMHLGTPAIDLAAAHTMLPPESHATFLEAYGPVSEALWNAARWRGIYSALICLEYGITSDAEDMRRCGAAAIGLIARGL
jgi:aminoglycoside phosphotransferase (APT) family kinase protein